MRKGMEWVKSDEKTENGEEGNEKIENGKNNR